MSERFWLSIVKQTICPFLAKAAPEVLGYGMLLSLNLSTGEALWSSDAYPPPI